MAASGEAERRKRENYKNWANQIKVMPGQQNKIERGNQ
jgi:hypothetical protein